jgi:hypothetical protein
MRLLSRMMSAALVVAALVSGCSSSSNNNDGSVSNTPPPTTKLVDLTPSEANQLCHQETSSSTGGVSCADGGANSLNIGVCGSTSIQPDCTATVATSQTCMAKLTADVCDYKAYTADLKTPECMVMLACTASLCSNTMFLCPDNGTLSTAIVTCKTLTKGLTTDCASCISGVFTGLNCPDFTKLDPPYDQCAAACTQTSGGG